MLASAEKLLLWRRYPVAFVEEVFGAKPDGWQREALEAFPHDRRIAMKASKGPGKSCVLAWCIWNFLATRPHPNIACTSITAPNLADGLWKELAKWQGKSPFLMAAFEWQKTRIICKAHAATWFASARNWSHSASPQEQSDTLAGLHSDYFLFVVDEAGGIPDAVMSAASAVLASGVETKIMIAGNPTHLEGPLYKACTSQKHLWHVIEINGDPDNPNRSSRISIDWAREMIEEFGIDHPWVRVNVFGRFPETSMNALLGIEDVREAMKRHYRPEEFAHSAKVLGIDVAREGDDRSVIFPRQGLVASVPDVLRNVTGNEGAARVAVKKQVWRPDAMFIDGTGGFGYSWLDAARNLGLSLVPIHFSSKPNDEQFFNKRAEMYWQMAAWIRAGGALPPNDELAQELVAPWYTHKGDKLIIEDKKLVKAKLGRSCDLSDGLALTFAQPVVARQAAGEIPAWMMRKREVEWDYNPLERI